MTGLADRAQSVGRDAVNEVAAFSKAEALKHLTEIWSDGPAQAKTVTVPKLRELRSKIARIDHSRVASERAEAAARLARDAWGIDPGPVQTDQLAELLSFSKRLITTANGSELPFEAGFRREADDPTISVALRSRHATGRRFALARLVGDHIAARSDRLLPATDTKTERQKFQRAFAQEFLCPFSDLLDFTGTDHPSDDTIELAADFFDVSPLLVKTTFVNKAGLERETLGSR
jgi:hypothetical protein